MDKRSIWVFCGLFLYFAGCVRLFSVHSIDLEVSPLIDQFSKYETPFMLSWIAISLIAKIIGARLFGKYADKYNIFYAIRVFAATHVIASAFIMVCFLTRVWFFNPHQFFYLVRFAQSLLEPAALILSAIFLIKINQKISAIYVSTIVNLVAGCGIMCAYLISSLINTYKINSWYPVFFAISVIGFWCFVKGTQQKLQDKIIAINIRLTDNKTEKVLAFSLGACCLGGIASISFCFDRFAHDALIIGNAWQNFSALYFYAYLLIAFFPAALIAKKIGMYKSSIIGISGAIITALLIYLLPFNQNFFLIIGLINVFCIAMFLASNHAFLHNYLCANNQYSSPVLWFTLGFAVFGAFNAFLQILSFWPLYIVGIMGSVPAMLLHLFCLHKIGTKKFSGCPPKQIPLNYTFSFKRWRAQTKTTINHQSAHHVSNV